MNKKSQGWLKFIRVLIYAVSIIGTAVGASLIKTGGLSASYADGTFIAKIHNGEVIFFTSLIILSANIMWGILRWFLRGYREKWRAGRIIGKLIGGGIWRTLVIIPLIIISIILITPAICNLIEENVLSEQISFEPYDPDYVEHRLEYLEEHLEELDPQEVYEELKELTFQNIRFGTDEEARENNISAANASIFTNNAYAYTPSVVFLNKAKLSSNGRFVIFYTSYGEDSVSDDRIEELGEMLENIIDGYENNLGLKYTYQAYWHFKYDVTREKIADLVYSEMETVLLANGIDQDIINTAMPVYIANPYLKENNTLATYAGVDWLSTVKRIAMYIGQFVDGDLRLYDTAPTFPFINIQPWILSKKSLAIVAAHELGHHFAHLYLEANNLESSTNNFVKETIANWMAINALPNEPVSTLINKNHYNEIYLTSGTGTTPTERMPGCEDEKESNRHTTCDGYPSVALLQNYYEIVSDAKRIMMNAVASDDALVYLYNQAGAEQFTKAMISLAEKNLTGDYGGKLINMTTPKGEPIECTDACLSTSYTVAPAATSYLYFSTTEYENAKVTFTGSDTLRVSILGLAPGGRFEIISSGNTEKEYQFSNTGRFAEYEVIAFAVANSDITNSGTYTIEIMNENLEDLLEKPDKNTAEGTPEIDATSYSFKQMYTEFEPGCYELDTDAIFDNMLSLISLGSDFISAISSLDQGNDYSAVKSDYEKSSIEAATNIKEAKSGLSPYKITACVNRVKNKYSFDTTKQKLRAILGHNLNFFNATYGSDRASAFAGFNLLTRTGKLYILLQHGDEVVLITVNVAER